MGSHVDKMPAIALQLQQQQLPLYRMSQTNPWITQLGRSQTHIRGGTPSHATRRHASQSTASSRTLRKSTHRGKFDRIRRQNFRQKPSQNGSSPSSYRDTLYLQPRPLRRHLRAVPAVTVYHTATQLMMPTSIGGRPRQGRHRIHHHHHQGQSQHVNRGHIEASHPR